MDRFIPDNYLAKTAEEQARLKGKFFKFINYASVDTNGQQDCKVTVSEKEGKIHLYVATNEYIKKGTINLSSTGRDGTIAKVTSAHKVTRIRHKYSLEIRQDLEVIIDEDSFLLEGFNRTYL